MFPVSSSILAAEALGPFLQQAYGLTECPRCRLLKAGINHTYLVDNQGTWLIFRIYSHGWRTRLEIAEELRLLRLLQAHQIPVSYPVADQTGNDFQLLQAPEGDRFGVMFSFAPGEKMHTLPDAAHVELGKIMARMHQVTEGLALKRDTCTAETLLVGPLAEIRAFLPAHTEEMQYLEVLQAWLLARFAEIQPQDLRFGAVHLDCWFDNFSVTPEGKATLFDFDFCSNGWLCLDIAYYLLQLSSIEREEAVCARKSACFLAGYESVTPISHAEKALLPALGISLYFFYLGVQCRRFHDWSNSFLNESYLKRFITGLVKRYATLNDIQP